MNCASRILPHLRERSGKAALWTARDGVVTFGEMGGLAASAQKLARAEGLVAGDSALVLAKPGPSLFATVTGLIAMGVTVIFVEPWMPVEEIDHVIRLAGPKIFFGNTLAQLWGARVRSVRRIPRWINLWRVARQRATVGAFSCDDVDPSSKAVITFTSGTTGKPKGIVRSHRYMWDTQEILTGIGGSNKLDAPDLCVFPNLVLVQLGTGRGAVLAPDDWSPRGLRALEAVPENLRPETLTCGPAFLLALLRNRRTDSFTQSLKSVYIGGALTDRWILEAAFERWSGTEWTHIYGGAEAEPVTYGDARSCVEKSAARGYFQTLNVGSPIPQISTMQSPRGLWVSGPNVAPRYVGNEEENRSTKMTDASGTLWHCMGDRIEPDRDGSWFAGRATQPRREFELEQRIYPFLGTSKCFVHRNTGGDTWLFGEGLDTKIEAAGMPVEKAFPEIRGVREVKIVRDRRHRARIDRVRSLGSGAKRAS